LTETEAGNLAPALSPSLPDLARRRGGVEEVDLGERVVRAQKDRRSLDGLITDYMPFIKKCVSGVFFKGQARRDNLTEAMLAFAHSVHTYVPEAGAFIPYASRVIHNRLIDAARKELRIQKPLAAPPAEADPAAENLRWEAGASLQSYDRAEEQRNLQLEIAEINEQFAEWGFSWEKLVKSGPKQNRSRRSCHRAARRVLESEELLSEILRAKQLPARRLAAFTGYSEKIFEKYRPYITAVILIIHGDYPYIHSFLPHFFDSDDEEDAL